MSSIWCLRDNGDFTDQLLSMLGKPGRAFEICVCGVWGKTKLNGNVISTFAYIIT